MKRTMIPLTLAALLLLTGGALAMFSDDYRLDWLTPLTGGGGLAESANKICARQLCPQWDRTPCFRWDMRHER